MDSHETNNYNFNRQTMVWRMKRSIAHIIVKGGEFPYDQVSNFGLLLNVSRVQV